ncbi:hypothetical protein CIRG_08970 [Coccidioides immitis RMSCC 2394]|uniref:Uncharacterized protein n=1 Tax=Coccidioides immitis RMSCC 2394 TaxID=404692 RepID=A0A0J7BHE8_COCIT|nr:hypothetical protein CIRG_08970 [Coccidioides immitis RMSCC 2394]
MDDAAPVDLIWERGRGVSHSRYVKRLKRASIPTSTVRVPAFRRHPSAETPSQELI